MPFCQGVQLVVKAQKPKDYSKAPQTLGEHLKKRRRDLGLLQREAAAALGIAIETYINWEKDRTRPTVALRHRSQTSTQSATSPRGGDSGNRTMDWGQPVVVLPARAFRKSGCSPEIMSRSQDHSGLRTNFPKPTQLTPRHPGLVPRRPVRFNSGWV